MTPKAYEEFFNEKCKDVGVYKLCLSWKGGGGHCTILQRFENGVLKYIEPQYDNSTSITRDLDYLCKAMSTQPNLARKGVMRIDDKLFNFKFISIFNKY